MKNWFLKFCVANFSLISVTFALSIPMNDTKVKLSNKVLDNSPEKSHEQIEKLMKAFEDHFSPLVEKQGGKLFLILNWESPRVIAEALRPNALDWEIVLHGGAARTADLSKDEISLILCHELGHHLGGKPTSSQDGWSACEGQADYWSSSSCISSILEKIKNEKNISPLPEAKKWCEQNDRQNEMCIRFAQSALNLTRFYGKFTPHGYPNLDTLDSTIPPRTFYGHPKPQCRLDTLLSGYLSHHRPACWYHY